jgi:hypothetical protein
MKILRPTGIAVLYAASLLMVGGCQREEQLPSTQTVTAVSTAPEDVAQKDETEVVVLDEEKFILSSRAGATLGSDGMVTADVETFKRGQPLHLSIWFKEVPAGLDISGVVYDENDQKVADERKPGNGSKNVTFTFDSSKWQPGMYRLVGNRGEKVVAEHVVKLTR